MRWRNAVQPGAVSNQIFVRSDAQGGGHQASIDLYDNDMKCSATRMRLSRANILVMTRNTDCHYLAKMNEGIVYRISIQKWIKTTASGDRYQGSHQFQRPDLSRGARTAYLRSAPPPPAWTAGTCRLRPFTSAHVRQGAAGGGRVRKHAEQGRIVPIALYQVPSVHDRRRRSLQLRDLAANQVVRFGKLLAPASKKNDQNSTIY